MKKKTLLFLVVLQISDIVKFLLWRNLTSVLGCEIPFHHFRSRSLIASLKVIFFDIFLRDKRKVYNEGKKNKFFVLLPSKMQSIWTKV